MTDILKVMKKSARNVQESLKPCDIVYGTVISTSPLKIQIDQKLILEQEQLKVTRTVTDYEVEIIIDGITRTCIIKNSLKNGDSVTMIRAHGGQQYIVIDKG